MVGGLRWAFIAIAASLIFSAAARADFEVIPKPDDSVRDTKDAAEKADDAVKRFKDIVLRCRTYSKSFDKLMSQIDDPKDTSHHYRVYAGVSGRILDVASGPGEVTVNVNNLEQLPDLDKDGKLPKDPSGGAAWWMTRCEDVAHFMGEAQQTETYKGNYTLTGSGWIRNQGLNNAGENFALLKDDPAHTDNGMTAQNAFRNDLGLKNTDNAKTSILVTDGSFSFTPLGKRDLIPTNGVKIEYGKNRIVLLTFDTEGLHEHLITGGSRKQQASETPKTAGGSSPSSRPRKRPRVATGGSPSISATRKVNSNQPTSPGGLSPEAANAIGTAIGVGIGIGLGSGRMGGDDMMRRDPR
jgi:hypothetical protein